MQLQGPQRHWAAFPNPLCWPHTSPHAILNLCPLLLSPPPPPWNQWGHAGQVGLAAGWLLETRCLPLDQNGKTFALSFCLFDVNFRFKPIVLNHPHLFCLYFQASFCAQQVQSPHTTKFIQTGPFPVNVKIIIILKISSLNCELSVSSGVVLPWAERWRSAETTAGRRRAAAASWCAS